MDHDALRLRFQSHLPKYGSLWKSMSQTKAATTTAPKAVTTDFLTAIQNKTTTTIECCPFGNSCDGCQTPTVIVETATLSVESPALSRTSSQSASSNSSGSTVVAFDTSRIQYDESPVRTPSKSCTQSTPIANFDMSGLQSAIDEDMDNDADGEEDSFEHVQADATDDEANLSSDESDDEGDDSDSESSGGTVVRFDMSFLAEDGMTDEKDDESVELQVHDEGFELLPHPISPIKKQRHDMHDDALVDTPSPPKSNNVEFLLPEPSPECMSPILETKAYETGDSASGQDGEGESDYEDDQETLKSDNKPSSIEDDSYDDDSENEWTSAQEEETSSIDTLPREARNVVVILSDGDDSSVEEFSKNKRLQQHRPFQKYRDEITKETFAEFNKSAFLEKLTSVEVLWSNKLQTTAGITRLIKHTVKGQPVQRLARIELNLKVIDEHERLRNTLLHEMCHAAQWLVDGVSTPPHGKVFKQWANHAMNAITDVTVTTTHDYAIQYKYAWTCTTPKCGVVFQRQSRSIDVEKQRCGKCKGTLVEINAPRKGTQVVDRTPKKKAPMSKYNQFVQENMAETKARMTLDRRMAGSKEVVTQSQVMSAISKLWKQHKEESK